jgi:shikimate kinase
MNIYLIGLPASGKSTCGKELAKTLNYTFVDLDKKIERDNNTTIPDIFKEGEEAFRTLETKAL